MLNFTKEERQAFLFIFTIVLIGLGARFSFKTHFSSRLISSFSKNLGKIDLNKADKDALMSIKGVGEKLAGRIIDYRNTRDGFGELEELKEVNGITASKYEKIKEFFYIE